jgi:GAF domain
MTVTSAGTAAAAAPALVRAPLPVFAPREIVANPERLSALANAGVLDTEPDQLLDLITGMAATLLSVSTVLLSIVDKDHEFFKSQIGVPEPWATARQVPLSHSFCQWVVSANEIMVVEDTREQPVLQSNLAIGDMNVIAYAGVPIRSTGASLPLGSFAAIDSKPRTWTETELANLHNLAGMAEAGVFLESKASAYSTAARSVARGVIIQNAAQILRRIASSTPRPEQTTLLEIVETQARGIAEVKRAR